MRNRRGFTLVEVLTVLALLGLGVGVVATFLFFTQHSSVTVHRVNRQTQNMQQVFSLLVKAAREASGIEIVDDPDLEDEPGFVTGENPTKVTLTRPAFMAGSDDIVFGYDKEAHELWLHDVNGPGRVKNIAGLSVEYDEGLGLVVLQLTSDDKIGMVRQGLPIVLETKIYLRNAGR